MPSNRNESGARRGVNAALALWLSLALAVTGCASPPVLPAGFAPEAAVVEAAVDARPSIVVEGPASKIGGMFRGLAWGGGIGLLAGLVAESGCSFTCGIATFLGGVIGGASGMIGGAVAAEHEADVEAKRAMLAGAVAARPHAQQLADALRTGTAAAGDRAPWTVVVRIVGLDTVGHGRDAPYRLRLRARLELRSAGAPEPATALDFDALSLDEQPTPQWQADGGRPLREALDGCVQSLAEQMRTAMRQRRAAP